MFIRHLYVHNYEECYTWSWVILYHAAKVLILGVVCIWVLKHCRKMIFRTYLPHNEVEIRYPNSCDIYKHYIFEYCLAQVILDNVDVSCSEDGNVYRPFLKSKTTTMFFFKKKFLLCIFMHLSNHIWYHYQPGMWWGILAPNVKYQNKNE